MCMSVLDSWSACAPTLCKPMSFGERVIVKTLATAAVMAPRPVTQEQRNWMAVMTMAATVFVCQKLTIM